MELTIELDDARVVMWEELVDELEDEESLQRTMERAVSQKLTHLYDNKDDIERAQD